MSLPFSLLSPRRSLRSLALVAVAVAVVAPGASVALAGSTNLGYRDFSYGISVTAPTADKPESKLWFADGIWWSSMFDTVSGDHHIFRLEAATQRWVDTGTLVDERYGARIDAKWDGTRLLISSHGTNATLASHAGRFRRYAYDAATDRYTLERGFPIQLTSLGVESLTIDVDSTGMVWTTWTQNQRVYVRHTTTVDHRTWSAARVLPFAQATGLTTDDISAVVAYQGRIGIMWGDQTSRWGYFFASHADGTPDTQWSFSVPLQGTELSDDHINIKALRNDPAGKVFAAVKTSRNASNDPMLMLLVLRNDGTWGRHVITTVGDRHTRPLVLIDQGARRLYVFMSAPCCSGGVIYYKWTDLDHISFTPGYGTPFISSTIDLNINNPTSTKQPITAASRGVVLASDDRTRMYLHNTITSPTMPTFQTFADGFETGGFSSWVVSRKQSTTQVQSSIVRTGKYAARFASTSEAAYARYSFSVQTPTLTASINTRIAGQSSTLLPLLDLEAGTKSAIAIVRGSDGYLRLRIGTTYRRLSASLPTKTWANVSLRVVNGGSSSASIEVRKDGVLVYSGTSTAVGIIKGITIGTDSPASFDSVVDDVRVAR